MVLLLTIYFFSSLITRTLYIYVILCMCVCFISSLAFSNLLSLSFSFSLYSLRHLPHYYSLSIGLCLTPSHMPPSLGAQHIPGRWLKELIVDINVVHEQELSANFSSLSLSCSNSVLSSSVEKNEEQPTMNRNWFSHEIARQ